MPSFVMQRNGIIMDSLMVLMIPVAVLAGFITSIAGGGGVVFVTSAVALGVEPLNALALNRITDLAVLSGSLKAFRKVPDIPWRSIKIMAPLFLIGAIGGASFAVSVPSDILKPIIIVASMIAISIIIVKPRPRATINKKWAALGYGSILAIGFWDGSIAMAGTTFFMIAAHYFFAMDYMKARVVHMYVAIPETIVSTSILTFHSTVTIIGGLSMFVAAFIGAMVGSHMAVKNGHEFIRKGMIAITLILIAKLVIYDWAIQSL